MRTNEKGISLKILLIIVLVVIVIGFIAFQITISSLKSSELEDRIADMLLIEAKVTEIYQKHEYDNGELLGELSKDDKLPDGEWYKLNNSDLKSMNIDVSLDKGNYYIDYKKGEVYYSEGYTNIDGKTVYTLSDMKKMSED